jgi:DNA-binding transcriptional ArsR family regulator
MHETNGFLLISDILKTMSRTDRLRLLLALESGRQAVSELTCMIHGNISQTHRSQTSAALAPMRRLEVVNAVREGQIVFYELTDLGQRVAGFVKKIQQGSCCS